MCLDLLVINGLNIHNNSGGHPRETPKGQLPASLGCLWYGGKIGISYLKDIIIRNWLKDPISRDGDGGDGVGNGDGKNEVFGHVFHKIEVIR